MEVFELARPPESELKPLTWALTKKQYSESFIEVKPKKGQKNRYSLIHDRDVYRGIDGGEIDIDLHDLTKKEVIEIAEGMRKNWFVDVDEDG